jgi:hypothetical protein
MSAVQQLKDADYQNTLNYCEWFIAQNGEDILAVMFYADEARLHLRLRPHAKHAPVVFGKTSHNFSTTFTHRQNWRLGWDFRKVYHWPKGFC